jgi:hypothetical protein
MLRGMNDDVRIEVSRSGGFAGIRARAAAATGDLDEAQAAELVALARRCGPTFDIARPAAAGPLVDRFEYEITMVVDGAERSVVVGDADLSPECRQLVRWVLQGGRPADDPR